jgi:hypothetical protein
MVGRMTERRPSIWKVLTDAEHVVVMHRLLRERPEMREGARRIATSLLAQTKRSEAPVRGAPGRRSGDHW